MLNDVMIPFNPGDICKFKRNEYDDDDGDEEFSLYTEAHGTNISRNFTVSSERNYFITVIAIHTLSKRQAHLKYSKFEAGHQDAFIIVDNCLGWVDVAVIEKLI